MYSYIFIELSECTSCKLIFLPNYNNFADITSFLKFFIILISVFGTLTRFKALLILLNLIYINKNLQYIIKIIIKALSLVFKNF